MMMSYLGCDCETKKVGADITTSANSTKHHFHLSIPLCDLQTLNLSPPPSSLPFLHSGSTHHQRATGVLRPPLGACVCLLLQDLVQSCLRGLPPTHPFVGAPILQRHFQVPWRARVPPPRVLLPHTYTRRMDGFCFHNADQLGSLAGLSLLSVYVGVGESAPASPYTYSSSTHRFPDERPPIEDTPLSATYAELGLSLGLGFGIGFIGTLLLARAPLQLSPPSFHTIFLFLAFTSVWWSD